MHEKYSNHKLRSFFSIPPFFDSLLGRISRKIIFSYRFWAKLAFADAAWQQLLACGGVGAQNLAAISHFQLTLPNLTALLALDFKEQKSKRTSFMIILPKAFIFLLKNLSIRVL